MSLSHLHTQINIALLACNSEPAANTGQLCSRVKFRKSKSKQPPEDTSLCACKWTKSWGKESICPSPWSCWAQAVINSARQADCMWSGMMMMFKHRGWVSWPDLIFLLHRVKKKKRWPRPTVSWYSKKGRSMVQSVGFSFDGTPPGIQLCIVLHFCWHYSHFI